MVLNIVNEGHHFRSIDLFHQKLKVDAPGAKHWIEWIAQGMYRQVYTLACERAVIVCNWITIIK